MYKQLIINSTAHETRVALVEDGNLAEVFIERGDFSDIAGNIYKGRVQRVLPGMQAAFIDIGLKQAAFLYAGDVIKENHKTNEDAPEGPDDLSGVLDRDFCTENAFEKRNPPIEYLIREGQEIMVHVSKSPIGTKGARVTSHISLPGRFLVLMPNSDHIGISRKIEEDAERNRLKESVHRFRDGRFGYIVRTAAEGVNEEKLLYEMRFLNNLWANIQKRFEQVSAPSMLHQELSVTLRAVRDLLIHEADKLIIDSRQGYEKVLSFIDTMMPGLKDSVELYEGCEPIFEAYNIEVDISRVVKRKVWLKSGGYIVIDHTEALVAIDVNTGRYVGKQNHNLEETILKINLEAVKEIAYQVRLRDIGGIIIIDFIDMEKKSNQEKVYNALMDALKKDRSKTKVLPMSEMGLIEMTRKRVKKSLGRMLCEPCFYCEGEGYLLSRQSVCYNLYREVIRYAKDISGTTISLRVNPEIAELLHGEENTVIQSLEESLEKRIVIYPDVRLHLENIEIAELLREKH
ncbi:MAG: Rne/Rng family ribonuclease [Desulfobacterales bacterium]